MFDTPPTSDKKLPDFSRSQLRNNGKKMVKKVLMSGYGLTAISFNIIARRSWPQLIRNLNLKKRRWLNYPGKFILTRGIYCLHKSREQKY